MKVLASIIFLLATSLLGACSGNADTAGSSGNGGNGGNGGGALSSSLTDTNVIGDLSVEDTQTLCRELNISALAATVLEQVCLQKSLFSTSVQMPETDAEARTKCASVYDECKNTQVAPTPCEQEPTCRATVGELERCTNDTLIAYADLTRTTPRCDELTLATLGAVDFDNQGPLQAASCSVVEKKCP